MAYVEIQPKSKNVQELLISRQNEIYDALGECVLSTFDIPETDMILEIQECRTVSFDPLAVKLESAPDVVIKLNTSDVQFKDRADELADKIVNAWKKLFGTEIAMECWIHFFHAWGCSIDFE